MSLLCAGFYVLALFFSIPQHVRKQMTCIHFQKVSETSGVSAVVGLVEKVSCDHKPSGIFGDLRGASGSFGELGQTFGELGWPELAGPDSSPGRTQHHIRINPDCFILKGQARSSTVGEGQVGQGVKRGLGNFEGVSGSSANLRGASGSFGELQKTQPGESWASSGRWVGEI